ncbi:hypothetical protein OIU79_019697 [Salix purpurea]|uniref:Pentatricopeptide repeat-containing protein n=1 Tax=Salix purpurea TaxID=77065 RepID=A0A9Q0P1V6_SALPP|nr:hypothetical protein OIU79_019697 [Salix purpurea]
MRGFGISLSVVSYNSLINKYCSRKDIGKAFEEDDGWRMGDAQSCVFLFRVLKKHKRVKMDLSLWNDMVVKDSGSCTSVSDELFEWLCYK